MLPFEVVGAPWIDGRKLAKALNALGLLDVYVRPHFFLPTASKWAGQDCYGVQVYTSGSDWNPILTWLYIIHTIKALYPDQFAWLPPHTTADGRSLYHFDRLIGTTAVREGLDTGLTVDEITAGWDVEAAAFAEERAPFLYYD